MKKEAMPVHNQTVEECFDESLMKMAAAAIVEKDLLRAEEAKRDPNIPKPDPEWLKQTVDDFSRKYAKLERKYIARQRLKKVGAFAAVFVILATGGFSATFFTVDAFRDRVINLYSDVHEEFTKLNISVNKGVDLSGWDPNYLPKYVPEGFYPQSVRISDVIDFDSNIVYKNDSKNKLFTIAVNKNDHLSMSINTEEMIEKSIQIKGYDAVLYYKEDYSSSNIHFSDHQATISIYGSISPDEIVKIAQSLSKFQK